MAHREAVTITNHGRDDVVLISAHEYERMARRKTTSMHVSGLSDEFLEDMLAEPLPEEGDQFDDEYPAPVR